MTNEFVVFLANVLQGCVPLLSLAAYLPQWRKLYKSKSSKDISLGAWGIWTLSTTCTLFYAIVQYQSTGQGMALVFSGATGLFFVIVTLYLTFIYRAERAQVAARYAAESGQL